MSRFLVFIALFGLCAASPQFLGGLSASQYRYQDEFGQHAFGHVGGPNSREEVRSADGSTRGSYSYIDANGLVQSAVYSADAANGFRVAATNLPVGPAAPTTPIIAPIAARFAYPTAFTGIHALKKRDLVAVGQPISSYPGGTAPLIRAASIAAPSMYYSTPAFATPIHAGAMPVPADEPIVAHAKAAQLIQQNTEGLRNNFGGVPLALPADTPEVAAGKMAHAIAHANQAASVSHPFAFRTAPFAHVLKKRAAVWATPYGFTTPIHAGAFPVPADEPIVAHAKNAQLIQQNTEGLRNTIGGIPLALPADTPEVAAGKMAHAIAHANQAASISHPFAFRTAPFAHVLKKRAAVWTTPFGIATPFHAGAFPVPADEPIVAHAKAAQLIQQNTEAHRNTFGGVPIALPADTPEVAAAKMAHAIAHANEATKTIRPYYFF